MNMRFYQCEICGKIIAVLPDSQIPTVCCGKEMKELVPNKTDGAFEKHVPVITVDGNEVIVNVGSQPHPMTDDHSITWIALKTVRGFQFRELYPGDIPAACFTVCSDDTVKAAYAYCNIHGFWGADIEA